MSDRVCRLILTLTMDEPKSAQDIIFETKIPHGTVYRRLKFLQENKLLHVSGSISKEGKRFLIFKSKINRIFYSFNCGSIEMEVIPNLPLIKN